MLLSYLKNLKSKLLTHSSYLHSLKKYSPEEEFVIRKIIDIFEIYPKNFINYIIATSPNNSDSYKKCYERLEFLGDSIIQIITTEFIFSKYPNKNEGELSELRAKIVSRENLNKIAICCGILNLLQGITKNNMSPNIMGNTLEAITGAIYLDYNFNITKKIIIEKIFNKYLNTDELDNKIINFKSKLIEYCQKEKININFNLINQHIEKNNHIYDVEVSLNDNLFSYASANTIKKAEQLASQQMLSKLNIINDLHTE